MAPDFAQAGYDCARAEVEQGGLLLDGSCRFWDQSSLSIAGGWGEKCEGQRQANAADKNFSWCSEMFKFNN